MLEIHLNSRLYYGIHKCILTFRSQLLNLMSVKNFYYGTGMWERPLTSCLQSHISSSWLLTLWTAQSTPSLILNGFIAAVGFRPVNVKSV